MATSREPSATRSGVCIYKAPSLDPWPPTTPLEFSIHLVPLPTMSSQISLSSSSSSSSSEASTPSTLLNFDPFATHSFTNCSAVQHNQTPVNPGYPYPYRTPNFNLSHPLSPSSGQANNSPSYVSLVLHRHDSFYSSTPGNPTSRARTDIEVEQTWMNLTPSPIPHEIHAFHPHFHIKQPFSQTYASPSSFVAQLFHSISTVTAGII